MIKKRNRQDSIHGYGDWWHRGRGDLSSLLLNSEQTYSSGPSKVMPIHTSISNRLANGV